MSDKYITLTVKCPASLIETMIAEISGTGFDAFIEYEDGFEASAVSGAFDENLLNKIIERYKSSYTIELNKKEVSRQNWNEEWEKNYEPVVIDEKCLVKADFHRPAKKYPYEVLINPKMSFGTGHHETTRLMISHQLEIDHRNKVVIDAGCGTGILSILAEKLGASRIEACDTDIWAVENSIENIKKNDCTKINIHNGSIHTIKAIRHCDILLANINKNVLLKEISMYAQKIAMGGYLIVSGFLNDDVPELRYAASGNSFSFIDEKYQNNWSALVFQKKTT